MKLLTFTLVLSLLAFSCFSQAHEWDWDKATKCAKACTKISAQFVRAVIPELRTYLSCVDYTPPQNPKNRLLKYVKVIFELVKHGVHGNINCLVDPLTRGVETMKPFIAQIDDLKCLH